MYLEPWMIVVLVLLFGLNSYLNFKQGKREGLLDGAIAGVEATFDYLEKRQIIEIGTDGSIQGFDREIKAVDISKRT